MPRLFAFLLLSLFFLAAPARAEWRRAESPNFIVYSEDSEGRLRERILLLEDFDRLLRSETSVNAPAAPTKLPVYILGSLSELRILRPFRAGVGGFYTANPHGIAAFADASAGMDDNEILFHEYAHHFMLQYAPGAYPLWYMEGFAEYFATARFSQGSINRGGVSRARGESLIMQEWLPIERVLFGDLGGLLPEQRLQFYAQSWLIVHYFYSTPERTSALRRYLAALDRGGTAETFAAATGMTPRQLTEELRRYVGRGRVTSITTPRGGAQAPAVTVTRLPRSADDLILYDAALWIGVHQSNRAASLQRIRAAAARHGGDPFARRVQAHAELLYGDAAVADRLLDGLLAESPNDPILMYLKGLRFLTEARQADDWDPPAREARRWFTRANRANPNHFQTLYRFAQSARRSPDYVSENTTNVLLLAHHLAPQVAEITMTTAAMLMNRDRFDEAAVLLQPLAADPHRASVRDAAKALLERARARQRPEASPDPASDEETDDS